MSLRSNEFYVANSLEFMKDKIDNEFVDLTVTSPPYDAIRNYEGYDFDYKEMLFQLFRITKVGGVVVWVVGDQTIKGSETGNSFRQALAGIDVGFNLHDTMIYQKYAMPFPEKVRYYQNFEFMFVFSKGKPRTIHLLSDRINTYAGTKVARKHGNRQRNGQVTENSAFRLQKLDKTIQPTGIRYNIWKYSTSSNKGDRIAVKHPASFPEDLASDHILSWSNEGDLVFDPMCGSGTTCKMAWMNKRNFIGVDCSQKYIQEICAPRLEMLGWKSNL